MLGALRCSLATSGGIESPLGGGMGGDGGTGERERGPSTGTTQHNQTKPHRSQFVHHSPPPLQLPSTLQQNSQSAGDHHPILSVNPSGPAGTAPNPLSARARRVCGLRQCKPVHGNGAAVQGLLRIWRERTKRGGRTGAGHDNWGD